MSIIGIIMKHRFFLILACLAALLPTLAHAEDWAFTGWYPYVYRTSNGGWLYEPANPPLAWDYGTNDWVPNPLGGRSFDLRKTFEMYPLQLDMTYAYGPDVSMRILFNFSGVDTSVVSWSMGEYSDSGTVYTRYSVDACAGTCLMLGSFPTGESFALELDFDTATSGRYRMIGLFPFFTYTMEVANHLGTLSGSFTLGQMKVD